MKGIIIRHFEYWMKLPIFDNHKILTIGYAYPNLIMSEGYNAPGSPYWALKAFAFLALPEEHEFWKVEPALLPDMNTVKCLENGEVVLQRTKDNVTLFTPGMTSKHHQPNYEEKYSKFAYSTKFGFSVSRSQRCIEEAAPDSMLAFQIFDHIFVKGKIKCYEVKNDRIQIFWSPFKGIDVKTIILIKESEYERIHEIQSDYNCIAYDCGFAVPIETVEESKCNENDRIAEVSCNNKYCKVELCEGIGFGKVIVTSPNTNILCVKTAIPSISYMIEKGLNRIRTRIIY